MGEPVVGTLLGDGLRLVRMRRIYRKKKFWKEFFVGIGIIPLITEFISWSFGVAIDGQTNPGIYQVFGGSIPNYTSGKIELLLRETDIEGTEDALALLNEWKQKKQYWGYWGMLIRTGQLKQCTDVKNMNFWCLFRRMNWRWCHHWCRIPDIEKKEWSVAFDKRTGIDSSKKAGVLL